MRRLRKLPFLISWVAVAATAIAVPQYQIFDLGVVQMNDLYSRGSNVSPAGMAVGSSGTGNGGQAFTWTQGGGLVALPLLSGRNYTIATSANDNGIVVGNAFNTGAGGTWLPVIWQNGVVSQLPMPPGYTTGQVRDVNASGIAVGSVGEGGEWEQAAIYRVGGSSVITATAPRGSQFATAYGINDAGRIVGVAFIPSNPLIQLGIVYDMPTNTIFEVGALPGDNSAMALAVSNNGQVVGSSNRHPFIWTEGGGMAAIPLLPGTDRGDAQGVNSAGWVVGTDWLVNSSYAPFLYDGTATYRLADLLPPGSGWGLNGYSPLSINDNGVIVGTGVHNGATRAFAIAPLRIAYVSNPNTFESTDRIFVMNEDGSNQTALSWGSGSPFDGDFGPKFSPDGTRIAFSRSQFVPPFTWIAYIMVLGPQGQIQLTHTQGADDYDPAWSPDGSKIVFVSTRDINREIYVMNADGSQQTRVTNNSVDDFQPVWSPDGTRIAFVSARQSSLNPDIFVMNADGSNQTNLTNNPANEGDPDWSPDGTKIAFSRLQDDNSEVYVMNADGSSQADLTNDPAYDSDPSWSSDGTKIAFVRNHQIYVMDADGSNQTNLTNNTGSNKDPDWQRLAPLPTPSVTPSPPPGTPSPTPTPPPPSATPTASPTPNPCLTTYFQENFDGVAAPALPAGWVTSFTPGPANCTPTGTCALGTNWATSATNPFSPPNCAFHDAPGCVTDSTLDTPSFFYGGPPGQFSGAFMTMFHSYDLQSGFDGAVLEISINGGPFTDIVVAGGIIGGGGYNGTISAGTLSPIAGRAAWTGNSGGYVHQVINLPPAASGQNIRLRFRLATDCQQAGTGWRIDSIDVTYIVPCPTPTIPPPSPSPTATASPPFTPTPPATPSASPTASLPPSPTPTATPSPTPPTQALNLSTRLRVQTGDNAGIGGFIITGNAPKRLLFRGIGPSLTALGITGALANPSLDLRRPDGTRILANNDWRETQETEIQATGIPPTDNLEAAIVQTLDPGSYTIILRGMGMTTGIGLVEIYDLDQGVGSKLANISTRAFVETGASIVIAGFIVGGTSGGDIIIVRGIGPSLTGLGISNALADPTLELRDGNGTLLRANNNWQDDLAQAGELSAAGLAPSNQLESGIAMTLSPGAYTALLAGLNNGTGVGLVEVYDLGQP